MLTLTRLNDNDCHMPNTWVLECNRFKLFFAWRNKITWWDGYFRLIGKDAIGKATWFYSQKGGLTIW